MDVASGTDRHLDITFGLQVVESSSLVYVGTAVTHFVSSFQFLSQSAQALL